MSGVDDAESFKIVRDALRVMEIGDEEQEALFLLLSVIIHLGNIEFASGEGDRARINNPVLVSTIAKVWILFPGGKKPVFCYTFFKEVKGEVDVEMFYFLINFSFFNAPRRNW